MTTEYYSFTKDIVNIFYIVFSLFSLGIFVLTTC
jgi:hypothetical protein